MNDADAKVYSNKVSCEVLMVVLLFAMVRLDVETSHYDRMIGLLPILKSVAISFNRLPNLWKKYLKQMILNI